MLRDYGKVLGRSPGDIYQDQAAMSTKNDYQLVVDFWRLFRKYNCPVSGEGYWRRLCADLESFVKSHDNTRFSMDLALALADELERRCINK